MSYFSGLQLYVLWAIHTILESLPISSSGHMALLEKIFGKKWNSSCEYAGQTTQVCAARRSLESLDGSKDQAAKEHIKYLMHLPTAFIITIFLAVQLFSSRGVIIAQDNQAWSLIFQASISIFWANGATLFFYFLFRTINTQKFPLWLGFLITSALLLSLFWAPQLPFFSTLIIPASIAVIIGIAQGISLLPGISRLAATVVTAQYCGLDVATAFLFSLIIQLPLILAALAQALYKIIFKKAELPVWNSCGVLLVACAAVISYALLTLVFICAQHNLLGYFGMYMLVPVLIAYFYC